MCDEQRKAGALLIVRQAQHMAEVAGLELTVIAFDDGEVSKREPHVLTLSTEGKSVHVELEDHALLDYPLGIAEDTILKIRCSVRELRGC